MLSWHCSVGDTTWAVYNQYWARQLELVTLYMIFRGAPVHIIYTWISNVVDNQNSIYNAKTYWFSPFSLQEWAGSHVSRQPNIWDGVRRDEVVEAVVVWIEGGVQCRVQSHVHGHRPRLLAQVDLGTRKCIFRSQCCLDCPIYACIMLTVKEDHHQYCRTINIPLLHSIPLSGAGHAFLCIAAPDPSTFEDPDLLHCSPSSYDLFTVIYRQ